MSTPSVSPAIVRLLLATMIVSVVALGVGLYDLLRAPASAPATATDELAAVRRELAELRHSVEMTRNLSSAPGGAVAIADAERRIARLEAAAQAQAPAAPAVAPPAADDRPGTEAAKVAVEKSPGGVVTVSGSGPALVNAALTQR